MIESEPDPERQRRAAAHMRAFIAEAQNRPGLDEDAAMKLAVEEVRAVRRERAERGD